MQKVTFGAVGFGNVGFPDVTKWHLIASPLIPLHANNW